jgi:hypothetical protein
MDVTSRREPSGDGRDFGRASLKNARGTEGR